LDLGGRSQAVQRTGGNRKGWGRAEEVKDMGGWGKDCREGKKRKAGERGVNHPRHLLRNTNYKEAHNIQVHDFKQLLSITCHITMLYNLLV